MRRAVQYVERRAEARVREALEDTRVVVISGARQVGKSTLAEKVLRSTPNGRGKYLDEVQDRRAADHDPMGFVQHDGLLLIDEIQQVPDLWLTIKREVDKDPRPGRFLLTGSARLLSLRTITDSLIGRSETIELWPLSQGEIEAEPDGFVDAAFRRGPALRGRATDLRRSDYLVRAARGGYPEALRRETARGRARFFESYVDDMINRDVMQVARIEQAGEMRLLLKLLAGQVSGLLKTDRLASHLAITGTTARSYIDILETIFLVRRVPAWSFGPTPRAVATPKLLFTDTGLAAHLASQARSESPDGALLENFVLGELARQLTWAESWAHLYHFRDRNGREVDAVLETNGGEVVGVEVKASQTVRPEDFHGLRLLRDRLGDRFVAGFVLYCGDHSLSFGDRLTCLPISALWTTEP